MIAKRKTAQETLKMVSPRIAPSESFLRKTPDSGVNRLKEEAKAVMEFKNCRASW